MVRPYHPRIIYNNFSCGLCSAEESKLIVPSDAMMAKPDGMLTAFKDVNNRLITRHAKSPGHIKLSNEIEKLETKLLNANMDQLLYDKPQYYVATNNIQAGDVLNLILPYSCPCASRGYKVAGCQKFFIFQKLHFSFYIS